MNPDKIIVGFLMIVGILFPFFSIALGILLGDMFI